MGLPTGTFTSQNAGILQVTLNAIFSANSYLDAGFPNSANNGGSNLALRGYAGPGGSPTYTATVDKYNLEATIELDYPGGNVGWPVGVVEAGHVNPTGIYSYGMAPVTLTCRLLKR